MWRFRAMNTDVTVCAPATPAAIAREVAWVFEAAERRYSRFRDDSELSRLNRATGPTAVSPPLLEALLAARRHAVSTGGWFDPAIGGALVAAGYDRSFSPGGLDRDREPGPVAAARFLEVVIDEDACAVSRPPELQIDLGGIAKGRAVDEAARLLPELGFVDAGGDAVLRGDGPDGDGWRVDVEDPDDARRVVATLVVRDRAVATSAPNRRRWRAGRGWAHHLIDPFTARPAASDLAQATVIAATAEEADVLAKVAFLLGAEAGARFLERRGAGGVLVGRDRAVRSVGAVEVDRA
jgi:thiamine biosynthesis lipoprotein